MVRGMSAFGTRVDEDTSNLSHELDASRGVFNEYEVEETPEDRIRAQLAWALGTKVRRGVHATQGLMLMLDLAGYHLVSKSGEIQFSQDGSVKLTKQAPKTIVELEAEHGREFINKSSQAAKVLIATL